MRCGKSTAPGAKAPDDEDARVALRYRIKKLLAADDSLATALAQLMEAAARPTSSQAGVWGEGAIT